MSLKRDAAEHLRKRMTLVQQDMVDRIYWVINVDSSVQCLTNSQGNYMALVAEIDLGTPLPKAGETDHPLYPVRWYFESQGVRFRRLGVTTLYEISIKA